MSSKAFSTVILVLWSKLGSRFIQGSANHWRYWWGIVWDWAEEVAIKQCTQMRSLGLNIWHRDSGTVSREALQVFMCQSWRRPQSGTETVVWRLHKRTVYNAQKPFVSTSKTASKDGDSQGPSSTKTWPPVGTLCRKQGSSKAPRQTDKARGHPVATFSQTRGALGVLSLSGYVQWFGNSVI